MKNRMGKKINLSKHKIIKCKCGCVSFEKKISFLKHVSEFSDSKKYINHSFDVLRCTKCGSVNTEILGPELSNKFDNVVQKN